MNFWLLWLRLCPRSWRATLVPGWRDLESFVTSWLASEGSTRAALAYDRLGVSDGRLSLVLRRIGSVTTAFDLVTRRRELTMAERARFSTHAKDAADVDWPHILSGTVATLAALYMLPVGVKE